MYFEEGLKTAQKAVAEALDKFNALLDSLSEEERGKLQRSMGMKMEQLKVRSRCPVEVYFRHIQVSC